MSEFITVEEVAELLSIKRSTIYSKIRTIPHYRIGRLVRFKKSEIEHWLEKNKVALVDPGREGKKILRRPREGRNESIQKIVRKNIDQAKGQEYNLSRGRPDKVRDPGKEVTDV